MQARLDLRPEVPGDQAADHLGRDSALRGLQRQVGRSLGRQRQGTTDWPERLEYTGGVYLVEWSICNRSLRRQQTSGRPPRA
jgi:hypothetical protein